MRIKSYTHGQCLPLKLCRAMEKEPTLLDSFTALTPAGRQGVIDAAQASGDGMALSVLTNQAIDSNGVFTRSLTT